MDILTCKLHPDEIFDSQGDLLRHYAHTHNNAKVECPNCHRFFSRRGIHHHMEYERDPENSVIGKAQRKIGSLREAAMNLHDGHGEQDGPNSEPLTSAATQPAVNGDQPTTNGDGRVHGADGALSAGAAKPVGLVFPGEESDKLRARKDESVPAKALSGGMMRVKGTIMHRTPMLIVSNETMALFEFAAAKWPDKYGKSADMAEDLSRFVDEVVISYFRLFGIGPVIYQTQQYVLAGGGNGNTTRG